MVEESTNYRYKISYCMARLSEVKKCKYYSPLILQCDLCKHRETFDEDGTYICNCEEIIE